MKVSGSRVAQHRAALVATARRLLQERGFAGAGVADISREAGLTQGALYSQFKSKDALAREALCQAAAESAEAWRGLRDGAAEPFKAFLDAYLCDTHVEDSGSGCLMAACVSDVARQDPAIAQAFARAVRDFAALIAEALPEGMPPALAERRALAVATALVGAVATARAVRKADPALSRDIIAAARDSLERLAAGTDGGETG
ncbi:MAG TPA: helix-turn-helix domain-containing protein [Acetobacteraceae bacterium]|nr:helix-turn-helix domain-containing protein [Acetobacteraceae bacterium]